MPLGSAAALARTKNETRLDHLLSRRRLQRFLIPEVAHIAAKVKMFSLLSNHKNARGLNVD